MHPDTQLADIAHTIQLAVAPVFLLTALGTILGVLANRLARVVDRVRVLRERPVNPSVQHPRNSLAPDEELAILGRRRNLVNRAIICATLAALLVCLVIAFAFLGFMLHKNFSDVMAWLFISAIFSFIGALLFFLREIILTVSMIRVS